MAVVAEQTTAARQPPAVCQSPSRPAARRSCSRLHKPQVSGFNVQNVCRHWEDADANTAQPTKAEPHIADEARLSQPAPALAPKPRPLRFPAFLSRPLLSLQLTHGPRLPALTPSLPCSSPPSAALLRPLAPARPTLPQASFLVFKLGDLPPGGSTSVDAFYVLSLPQVPRRTDHLHRLESCVHTSAT